MQARQRFDGFIRNTYNRRTMHTEFAKLLIDKEDCRQVTLEETSKFLCRETKDLVERCCGGGQASNTAQRVGTHGTLACPFDNEGTLYDRGCLIRCHPTNRTW